MADKILYIRLGIGLVFYEGDRQLPDDDPLHLIDPDGEAVADGVISFAEWSAEVIRIAAERGFTRIYDQNIAEDGLLPDTAWSEGVTLEEHMKILQDNY
jgi:hypothetical protein